MSFVIDFILHFDRYLFEFVQSYGNWAYGLLFAIVFAETGLVVTPFLPGDSLLFAVGALAAIDVLNPYIAIPLLFTAAFTGNAVNYAIGRRIGLRVFAATERPGWSGRLLNQNHLTRGRRFFDQYGGKAVVMGRFVPIVRTFVPFVAGAAQMPAASFVFYNFIGAALWVGLCCGAGMLFGQVPFVKDNFAMVTIGIVVLSMIPVAVGLLRQRAARV